MKSTRFVTLIAAGVLLLSATGARSAHLEDKNTVKEGDSIPAFKGRNLLGEEIDFGDLLGKKAIVIAFWSIYCKPCVEEISSLIRITDELAGENLEVIGVNTDSELGVGRIRKFISRFEEFEKKRINYEIIYDEGNRITQLLGIGFLPTVLSINTRREVEKIFVGFEEISEVEIFEGIKSLLSDFPAPLADTGTQTYSVEAVVQLCGFYGPDGWMGNFTGNQDLEVELDETAEMARRMATKLILKEAIIGLGINLAEDPEKDSCFRPYGVYIMEDPLEIQDNLSNLIRELPVNRLVRTQESEEDFLGSEYRVNERASVNLTLLDDILDNLGYETVPRTVTFSVINIKKLDQVRFERILLQQSRFIGTFNFPTYTIYTSAENFVDEMKRMDLEGLRLFIEETTDDSIEVEAWR